MLLLLAQLLLLPHLSFKVPDLLLLQALGSFQGWSQAEQPPPNSRSKASLREGLLIPWVK